MKSFNLVSRSRATNFFSSQKFFELGVVLHFGTECVSLSSQGADNERL